jgi:hypothetical protein
MWIKILRDILILLYVTVGVSIMIVNHSEYHKERVATFEWLMTPVIWPLEFFRGSK